MIVPPIKQGQPRKREKDDKIYRKESHKQGTPFLPACSGILPSAPIGFLPACSGILPSAPIGATSF